MRTLAAFLLLTSMPMFAATITSLNGGPIQSNGGTLLGEGPGPFVASNLTCTGQNCGSLVVDFSLEENGSIYRNPFGYNLTFSDNNGTITTTSPTVSFSYAVTTSSYFMPANNQAFFLAVPIDFMGQLVTSFTATITDSAGTTTTLGGFVDPPGGSGSRLTSLQITETLGLAPLASGTATAGTVGTEFFVPEPSSATLLLFGLLTTAVLVGLARITPPQI